MSHNLVSSRFHGHAPPFSNPLFLDMSSPPLCGASNRDGMHTRLRLRQRNMHCTLLLLSIAPIARRRLTRAFLFVKDSSCVCPTFYRGDACELTWQESVSGWYPAMNAYGALTAIAHSLSPMLRRLPTVAHLRLRRHWKVEEDHCRVLDFSARSLCQLRTHRSLSACQLVPSISFSIVLCLCLLLSVRCIEFAVDPHSVRSILPPGAESTLFDLPLICWMALGFLLQLHWFVFLPCVRECSLTCHAF